MKITLSISLLFIGFIVLQTTQANVLSPIEKQISQIVAQQKNQPLTLLKKIVNINSSTTHIAGVHQVGEILRPQFEKLGFKTRWIEEPAAMKHAGTLIAERKGSAGKRILLIGHLDTVFPQNSPFQKFKLLKNGVPTNNEISTQLTKS